MKSVCTLVVLLLNVSSLPAERLYSVRPLDPWAAESLERGLSESPFVFALVAILEKSDVIVYVATSETLPYGMAGQLQFMTAQGGYRFLRVTLDRTLSPNHRAATLGHELQHAREVAESTVVDGDGMRGLYTAIGRRVPGMKNSFETAAAAQAGQRVWSELRGLSDTPREPARARAHGQ